MSGKLRAALREASPGESVWACAKRLGFLDQAAVPRKKEGRISNFTVKIATERKFEKNSAILGWVQCLKCWKALVRECFKEYGHICSVCGARDSVTAHHIVPRSERGANEVWNLMPLCEGCHNFIECHDSGPRTREDVIRCGRGR